MKINQKQHITRRGVIKRNPTKFNNKDLDYVYKLGVKAFKDGKKAIPHLDVEMNNFIQKKKFKVGEATPYLKKWYEGWNSINIKQNIYCVTCGDKLSSTEIKNGEDTCYPCQKGNTPESQEEANAN